MAYFTIKDVAKYAGYNGPSMVDYLVREKLLVPVKKYPYRKGRRRLFDLKQLILAKVYRELLDKGVTVSKIRKAISKSQDLKKANFSIQGIQTDGYGAAKYFVTDGLNVYLRTANEGLLNPVSGQFSFSYMLDLAELHSHVVGQVLKDRPELKLAKK
ncbi:MAG: MerR family transcriptional regulator [Alphaproteobacteria bacterium]|nr:MerR family transcriptional regulator [Alphaproteobacteria bacterium]